VIGWKPYCEIPALATVLFASRHESAEMETLPPEQRSPSSRPPAPGKKMIESPVFVGM
jgi:hypothetical protein